MSSAPRTPASQETVTLITRTETKCDCSVFLFRPTHGESLNTTQPTEGFIDLNEMHNGVHSLWFGIIELLFWDDTLLRAFDEFECHVVLEDGRRASGAIGQATGTGDYMVIFVLGWSKLVAIDHP